MTSYVEALPNQNDNEPLDFSKSRAAAREHLKIVEWTLGNFTSIKNARVTIERQWYLNLAFYYGKQNVIPHRLSTNSSTTTKLWTPPAPYYRARPVLNKVRPMIRTELAQLTNNKPNASVIPASAEDLDLYAANAGEQIWEHLYREKKLKFIISRAVLWALVCGNGFIKACWQPRLDDIYYIKETPFHVLCPDFREEELEYQPFLIHAQAKSPEFVKMNFQKALDGSEVKPSLMQGSDLIEESFLNLAGTQTMNNQHSVLIYEIWVKPGTIPQFPEGAFYTIVGDKIVEGFRGWPFSHGKYPFAKIDHIPSGKFYGTSSIEDLIPIQREINRTHGQIIEAKNRMAKPQWIAQRGAVNASQMTSEPGQIIEYTPGFEQPRQVELSPLPNYVMQELDRLQSEWNDISGQHEITHGQIPPGVTAATAISYLQERDESKLTPTFDSLEDAIEKIAQLSLSYVKDYWKDERIVKVLGPDGSFDAIAFKGSDLRGNLDIKVEAGSSLPTSKAAKQALIMDMMKMGFIDPQKGLEVMDMGGINKIYEQIQVDQHQAQRENLKMSKITEDMLEEWDANNQELLQQNPAQFGIDPVSGQALLPPPMVPVNTWDNHKIHVEYHNNYRKGQAFENLGSDIKVIFEEHVMEHIRSMGLETQTLDPRQAVGLPPVDSEAEETTLGTPGPNPMPQLEGEML